MSDFIDVKQPTPLMILPSAKRPDSENADVYMYIYIIYTHII